MILKRRMVAIALIIVLLLACQANGESIVSGSDIATIYDSMIISFELGKYDDVVSTYESTSTLATYKDADKYYRFSMAQIEIEKGEFEVSAYLFKGLGEFNNSSLWYSYAMGRASEQKGQYDEAIEFYTTASSLPETDSIGRMKDCISKISTIEQLSKYSEAVNSFEAASQNKDIVALRNCLNLFNSMGDYKDSSEYAKKCEDLIAQLERTIVLSSQKTINGEMISWIDSESGKAYVVSIREGNSLAESARIETTEKEIELTSLIPGTTYSVTVMDADNHEVFSNCTFSTLAAERLTRDDIHFKRISLVGIEKQVLDYAEMSFEELYEMKPSLFTTPENSSINYQLLENSSFCFITSLEYLGEEDITIPVMSILRSDNNGVRKTEEKYLNVKSKMFMITMDLNDLLQQFVNSVYDLKTDSYKYELYIDGQLCAEYVFAIEGR